MKLKKPWSQLSVLTVTPLVVILIHLYELMSEYDTLAKGEGWGVVGNLAILFWSSVFFFIGLVITRKVTYVKARIIIEIIALLVLLYLILFAD